MADEMLDGFNDRARRVVDLAGEEARRLNHSYLGTEHILLGLIREGEGIAIKALEALQISPDAVRQETEQAISRGKQAPPGHIPLTPRAVKVLTDLARREARQLGHSVVGTEDILLGLLHETDSVAAQVLMRLGADLGRVRQQVIQLRHGYQGRKPEPLAQSARIGPGGPTGRPPLPAVTAPVVLDQFGQDLTRQAGEGRLAPVAGRDHEIEAVIQALSQPAGNTPVLVGGASSGRMAVIEGLAQKIAAGEVPETIRNKRLYAFDADALAAGDLISLIKEPELRIRILDLVAPYDQRMYGVTVSSQLPGREPAIDPGQAPGYPERQWPAGKAPREPHWNVSNLDVITAILEEGQARGDIIVFIDKLSKLAGTAAAGSATNATSILAPMLARRKLQVIGAATAEEYRSFLDADEALSPHLRPVPVAETTISYSIGMLKIALRAATRARISHG